MTRKELLAVVRFTRQYRHYLLGREFLLRIDHNNLTWLLPFKYLGQLAWWLEELSQLHIIVLHQILNMAMPMSYHIYQMSMIFVIVKGRVRSVHSALLVV